MLSASAALGIGPHKAIADLGIQPALLQTTTSSPFLGEGSQVKLLGPGALVLLVQVPVGVCNGIWSQYGVL